MITQTCAEHEHTSSNALCREWVNHYIREGADHIYLIDNNSTDNGGLHISDFVEKGLVTMIWDPTRHFQVLLLRVTRPAQSSLSTAEALLCDTLCNSHAYFIPPKFRPGTNQCYGISPAVRVAFKGLAF